MGHGFPSPAAGALRSGRAPATPGGPTLILQASHTDINGKEISVIHPFKVGAKTVVGMMAATLGVSVFAMSSAFAVTAAGPVTISNSVTGTPLTGAQGSSTDFVAGLPQGAVCPAPSSTGERVYSFMVAPGTDPTTLTFTTGFPSNTFPSADVPGYYDTTGAYWTNGGGTTDSVGKPLIPTLNWGAGIDVGNITIDDLTPGASDTWDTGIICVKSNGTADTTFWDQQVTFTRSGSDSRGFTWTPVPNSNPAVPESPLTIALPIGGFLVLGIGVVVNRRRHATRTADAVSTV